MLLKRTSLDLPDDVSYPSRAVVNYKMGKSLAKMKESVIAEQLYNIQLLAG